MMTDWYHRMINALQLNGKGERTQQAFRAESRSRDLWIFGRA